MAAIAQLKAVLKMDNAQYKAGARGAKTETSALRKSIAAVGPTIAAAFSVGAIIAATKSIINFASEIRHTADNLEIGTDSLQALNSLTLKYGVSVEKLHKSLGKLRQSQGKVSEGDKEYTDALDALGISQAKFATAGTDEALEMLAKAYSEAEDRTLAFTAVSDLMGRGAKDLTAAMQELSKKGLQQVTKDTKAAGDVMEEQLLTRLELAGTRMEQFWLKAKVGAAEFFDEAIAGAEIMGRTLLDAFKGAEGRGMVGVISDVQTRRFGGKAKAPEAKKQSEVDFYRKQSEQANLKQAELARATREKRARMQTKVAADNERTAQREAEKANRDRTRRDDAIARIKESGKERIQREREREISITGTGQNTDSMAQTGGFVGASRGNLGIADRQIKLAQEAAQTQKRIEKIEEKMAADIAKIENKMQPNGTP
jgi:uncharacterized phage infection (PIP) family protein YhgE